MNRAKGFGYCGLACCVCSESQNCVGCRNEGCAGKDWCKSFQCCKEKGLAGCWQCLQFPCSGGMLDKLRVRAFSRFIVQYGQDKLMKCLEENEKAGIVYHYPGKLTGDYDQFSAEAEIIRFIIDGK